MAGDAGFGKRLLQVRGNASRRQFAKEIGVSEGAVAKYETEGTMPAFDVAARIARLGNVSLEWLAGLSSDPGGAGELTEVPRFEQSASAGTGMAILEEMPNGHLRISEEWLARIAPRKARLGVLDITGDSMTPTLQEGDLVVVNFDQAERPHVTGGGIFVFSVGPDLYVKRLAIADGQLVAISDNSIYETMRFDLDLDRTDVLVHGKVIWVAGPPRVLSK